MGPDRAGQWQAGPGQAERWPRPRPSSRSGRGPAPAAAPPGARPSRPHVGMAARAGGALRYLGIAVDEADLLPGALRLMRELRPHWDAERVKTKVGLAGCPAAPPPPALAPLGTRIPSTGAPGGTGLGLGAGANPG